MVNILLNRYSIGDKRLCPALAPYLHPQSKVVAIPFAFRDSRVHTQADWDALYSPEHGRLYPGITDSFAAYGIPRENITFLQYFADTPETARQKVTEADVLYFLGGLPERMAQRLEEFGLTALLAAHPGTVMGYSAGALIQLAEYHISPDEDYPEFTYGCGIPYLHDFYVEVHYEDTDVQNYSIARVLAERGKPVWLIRGNSAIIVDNGAVHTVGEVELRMPAE